MAAVVSLFWHSIMLERPEVMLLVWGAAMLGTFLLDLCLWRISYPDKRRWGDSLSQAHFYKWQSTKQFYTRRYIMRTSIRNILSAIIIMSVLLCNAMAIEKENIKINSAAEELIVDFLDAYSTSLVELTPLDYSDFFGIRRAQLFLPYLLTIELNMTAYGIADIVTFRLILNLVISAQLMTKSLPM